MILSHSNLVTQTQLLKFGDSEMTDRVGIRIKKPQDASHPGALS